MMTKSPMASCLSDFPVYVICMYSGTIIGIANFGFAGGSARLYPSNNWLIAFGYLFCASAKGLNYPSNCIVVLMARNASATVCARALCLLDETLRFLTCAP